ncbi:transporter, major facilitator family protein [Limosilactobacillus coleohominis 101-4-CHN]|uniref:Transporter, major facilitator family protein n=1 Tax=Limosilactobacillus coleohominis 101-4-CHN TaxID=575594 RepID=C7XVM5_9LACO|nr:MFS transporter [Limosilactobacillus coleohominis]EEU30391.1 transporter, major facilitator family protein [Limosilactobacillus coleohominis 101-4-CHN]
MEKTKVYSRDVVLVMAASFFFMFSTMFVTPLMNGYARSLGAGPTLAGVIVGIMSIAAMFLRPVAGNLTDRFSKYGLSFIGGILILVGVLGYVITPNSQLLLVFRLINGTGYVLDTVCMTTWLAYLVPREHVGEAMGFYGLMNALAMAIGPAISINIYQKVGFRVAMLFSAVAALLMVIMIQFVGQKGQPISTAHHKQTFKIIQWDALPVAILITLFALPYFATQADIVTYVAQRRLDVAVGAYFLIYAVILLVLRIALKNLFDTVKFGWWLLASTAAMVFYLIMLAMMHNNWQMALGAAGMAVGYGIIYSVLQSTALLLAPLNEQGLASSTFYLGLDIAMSLGPIMGGVIDSALPVRWYYPVMMLLVPIIIVVYLLYHRSLNEAIHNH